MMNHLKVHFQVYVLKTIKNKNKMITIIIFTLTLSYISEDQVQSVVKFYAHLSRVTTKPT
jgi:hypothetical protein